MVLIARADDSLLELQVINKEVHVVVLRPNLVPSLAGCQGVVEVVPVRAPYSTTCRATRSFLKGKTYAVPGLLSPQLRYSFPFIYPAYSGCPSQNETDIEGRWLLPLSLAQQSGKQTTFACV